MTGPRRDAQGRLTGGNPRNKGGGRPRGEFRAWAALKRDTLGRAAVERILGNPKHRDHFKAVEFVARWGASGEAVITASELTVVLGEVVQIIEQHVAVGPEQRAAVLGALDAAVAAAAARSARPAVLAPRAPPVASGLPGSAWPGEPEPGP